MMDARYNLFVLHRVLARQAAAAVYRRPVPPAEDEENIERGEN